MSEISKTEDWCVGFKKMPAQLCVPTNKHANKQIWLI